MSEAIIQTAREWWAQSDASVQDFERFVEEVARVSAVVAAQREALRRIANAKATEMFGAAAIARAALDAEEVSEPERKGIAHSGWPVPSDATEGNHPVSTEVAPGSLTSPVDTAPRAKP